MAKNLLLHEYDTSGKITDSRPFGSRGELASYLRKKGVRVANGAICDIGEGLVTLAGPRGEKYEIEELVGDSRDDVVMIDGKCWISIGKYCRDTGRSERDVYRAHHLDRRKGNGR